MTYLGDISYLHGSNDLKQHNSGSTITGSTDSDAYSIGVRAERGIGLGMGTLTPFAGLRYAHLGTDAYTDSIGVRHDSDDANVWMFPLGLRYSADIKNGIWTIRPMAEAGYVWTFGDRDGTDKVSLAVQATPSASTSPTQAAGMADLAYRQPKETSPTESPTSTSTAPAYRATPGPQPSDTTSDREIM